MKINIKFISYGEKTQNEIVLDCTLYCGDLHSNDKAKAL